MKSQGMIRVATALSCFVGLSVLNCEVFAQDGFDNGSLKGVYALHSTTDTQDALIGVIEFDAKGSVVGGSGTVILTDLEPGLVQPPLPPVIAAPYEIDFAASEEGDNTYSINRDGTGTMTTVSNVLLPGFEEPLVSTWNIVITIAKKDTGIAEEFRWISENVSLTSQIFSGFTKKLPRKIIRSLNE